jgi:tetratricopeptide (TPR) repeat protein
MLPKSFRRFAPALLALASLAVTAAEGIAQAPTRPAAPATTPAPAPESNRVVRSPGNAEWAPTLADARRRAAAEKKLVFYELTREGCGDCRRMEGLLYPAFDFEALLTGMVPVRIDLDSPDGRVLAERYTIQQAPSILITSPDGRLAFMMQNFKNAPDFWQHVRPDLDRYRKFSAQVDAQDVPRLSASEAFKTGSELFARFDFDASRERLKRASTAPDATPQVKSSALQGLAASELQLGRVGDARKSIEQAIAVAPDGDHRERAELFRAQIPLSENKPDEALALYRKFAKDHPDSKYMERVKTFIGKLEAGGTPK